MLKLNWLFCWTLLLFVIACAKEDLPESASYDTSHTENWMQDLLTTYPNELISLKDVCLPRAHDAGVFVLTDCFAGNACNTKTQYLNMEEMLKSGVRVFDLRPVLENGVFWTYHKTNCNGLGCNGERFDVILEQTKTYLESHNELLIFQIGHLCNIGPTDVQLQNLLTSKLGNTIFKENVSNSIPFSRRDLNDIIPTNFNNGKVVLLINGLDASNENPQAGFFAPSFIPFYGTYANNPDIDAVIADQKQKVQNYDSNSDDLLRLSYTFTLNTNLSIDCFNNPETALSIESISLEARDRLNATMNDWIGDQTINADKIPNILSIDFANTTVTEECIRLSKLSLE